jgi:hypothetical protein
MSTITDAIKAQQERQNILEQQRKEEEKRRKEIEKYDAVKSSINEAENGGTNPNSSQQPAAVTVPSGSADKVNADEHAYIRGTIPRPRIQKESNPAPVEQHHGKEEIKEPYDVFAQKHKNVEQVTNALNVAAASSAAQAVAAIKKNQQPASPQEDAFMKIMRFLEPPKPDEKEKARLERSREGKQIAQGFGLLLDMAKMIPWGRHYREGTGSVDADNSLAKGIAADNDKIAALNKEFRQNQQSYKEKMQALYQHWLQNEEAKQIAAEKAKNDDNYRTLQLLQDQKRIDEIKRHNQEMEGIGRTNAKAHETSAEAQKTKAVIAQNPPVKKSIIEHKGGGNKGGSGKKTTPFAVTLNSDNSIAQDFDKATVVAMLADADLYLELHKANPTLAAKLNTQDNNGNRQTVANLDDNTLRYVFNVYMQNRGIKSTTIQNSSPQPKNAVQRKNTAPAPKTNSQQAANVKASTSWLEEARKSQQ